MAAMSKRKPVKSGNKLQTAAKVTKSPGWFSVDRPDMHTPQDKLWKQIFWGFAAATALLGLVLSLQTGINGDDEYQNDYSRRLTAYYSTGGADTSALYVEKGNMHLYGGFFDLLTGLANQAMGYELADAGYHDLRHIFNFIFGWLAMLFTALLVREIAGWRAALIALVMIALSPRFLGHSLMNPKDIPFATGYIMAIYFMGRWIKGLPQWKWTDLLGMAIGIGIAIGTRAGGLLLFAYLGLFAGVDFLAKNGFSGLVQQPRRLGAYAATGLGAALGGYILALLVWPWALQSPIENPLKALSEFSKFGINIRVLFEGENTMSDQTPWYYPLSWIYRTIPLAVLAGFVAAVPLFPAFWRKYSPLLLGLALFSAAFPLFYILYKDSILYDGWRHLIFVYPGIVVGAAVCWNWLLEKFSANRIAGYALWGLLALATIEPLVFILRNTAFPYVYFNPLSGGINGAYGEYETDYWGLSVRQAVERMEKEGILRPDMQPITIASSFSYNLGLYITKKYGDKVKPAYVRYYQRYTNTDWDYAIFPSRYVKGQHLKEGVWPPAASTVFAIEANGVPLAVVLKNNNKVVFEAEKAAASQDWETAINLLSQVVAVDPDNEISWLSLANAYLNTSKMEQCIQAADESLRIYPGNLSALIYKGVAQVNLSRRDEAIQTFEAAAKADVESPIPFYYLGLINEQSGNITVAINYAEKSLQIDPRSRLAMELAARLYERSGDSARAQEMLKRIQQTR